jgi:Nitroreductase
MTKHVFLLLTFILATISCSNPPKDMKETTEMKNHTLNTILNRKSVRDFLNKEISEKTINDLLRAGMAAPSSRDRRPWHFIVISDKELMASLGSKLRTASSLNGANKAIVVCGDIEISDNCWFLDGSAAIQNILLAAESMELGAVWCALYPYDERMAVTQEALGFPDNIKPLAIIPLGYPKGVQTPKDKFDETRIHYNGW